MTRLAALLAAGALAGGCTTVGTASHVGVRPLDQALYMGSMGDKNDFEKSVEADQAPAKNPNAAPVAVAATGIIGGIFAASALSFGIAGAAMNRKLDKGFEDGFTVDEEDKIRSRGKAFNTIAITSGAVAAVSLAVAAIVYGVDYTRCGKLGEKRRKCAKQVEEQ